MGVDPGTGSNAPAPARPEPPPGYQYDSAGNLVAIPLDPWAQRENANPGSYAGLTVGDITFTRSFEDLATDIKRKPTVFLNSKVTGRQSILDEGMVMSTDISAIHKTEQTMRSAATLISGMSLLASANELSYGETSGTGGGIGSYAASGGSGYISPEGKTFPLGGTPSFSDSWGDPRSGGRTHKGNDLMAPRGTPVLAIADGVITEANSQDAGLGGRHIWLKDNNGTTYYYAHLDSIAGGIGVGTQVKVGQVIAFNGNTGNARGGECHVHFEIHPNGGAAVDPHDILTTLVGGTTA